jgi:hypothetical protein
MPCRRTGSDRPRPHRAAGHQRHQLRHPALGQPPGAPKPVTKKATGQRPGGQPGHPARLKRRLPPERLHRVIPLVPGPCDRCQAPLPPHQGPVAPESSWHQVANVRAEVSDALPPAHTEAPRGVRAAAVQKVDETSWKLAGKLCWRWVAATGTVAAFLIHAQRGAEALAALLGEKVQGFVCSDRWGAYAPLSPFCRQVCWAHLRRDFQAMIDRANEGSAIGEELLLHAALLFAWWYEVLDGTRTRAWLRRQLERWLRADVRLLLERGAACACAKTAGTCRELLRAEEALWTFARVAGVGPTNHAAEGGCGMRCCDGRGVRGRPARPAAGSWPGP